LQFKVNLGKWFARPYLKNTQHIKWLAEGSRCRSWVQTPVLEKKKKRQSWSLAGTGDHVNQDEPGSERQISHVFSQIWSLDLKDNNNTT
jgi:hypothetical protein